LSINERVRLSSCGAKAHRDHHVREKATGAAAAAQVVVGGVLVSPLVAVHSELVVQHRRLQEALEELRQQHLAPFQKVEQQGR
jgi:hypothetical protein